MNKHPLFALLRLSALAEHAKANPEPRAERPVERKPLSRKLECPDCGQEVLLVRSTTTEEGSILDVHFLQDDGDHFVAGLKFATARERDDHFQKLTYEDTKSIFSDMMGVGIGDKLGSLGLADLLGALSRNR